MSDKTKLTHRPFKKTKVDLPEVTEPAPPPTAAPVEETTPEPDEDQLYEQAMMGVSPMKEGSKLAEHRAKPKPALAEEDEEALVMRKLDELVHGDVPFDFADTDEYIEAHVAEFDTRIVRKLKRGEYSIQAHIDLHGCNREQARGQVAEFIRKSVIEGKRCVLIVHGRGLGSKDNIPVLKNKLASWLTRGSIGQKVLAFTSAKPYDGGTGAVYVLLRQGPR